MVEGDASILGRSGTCPTAVNRDLMTSSRQPGGQFLGEGFKAAVTRRNASRSEDGDAHTAASGLGYFGTGLKLEYSFLRSFRRGSAYRFVAEPGGDLFRTHLALFLNQLALGHDPFPVLRQEPERLQR